MVRSPSSSPGHHPSNSPPPATGTRTRRAHQQQQQRPPRPSLSSLNTLLICSLLLPLAIWLFSSSSNGHSNGSNLARTVSKDAKVIEGWVDHKSIHRDKARGTQKNSSPVEKRGSDTEVNEDDKDEPEEETSEGHPLTPLLPYLLLPPRFLLYLLSTLLSLLYYVCLPVLIPLHALVVLPTRLVYSLTQLLMPVVVFLGSCAVVGGLMGGGAAGVLRAWVWLSEGGGAKGERMKKGNEQQTDGRSRGKGKEKERY